jgi:hypothetical protein
MDQEQKLCWDGLLDVAVKLQFNTAVINKFKTWHRLVYAAATSSLSPFLSHYLRIPAAAAVKALWYSEVFESCLIVSVIDICIGMFTEAHVLLN